jgi:transcriptional regulator with XRE-family HTH domain
MNDETGGVSPDPKAEAEGQDRDSAVGRKLAELSTRCGLSLGMLSQVERGVSSPSIRSLQRLAGIFGVPVGWFFSDPQARATGPAWVLRRAQRRVLDLSAKGITKELLTPEEGSSEGSIELMLITVEPGGSSGEAPYSHAGEDSGTVLEGMLELEVNGEQCLLHAGDSFRFASVLPHRFANGGTLRCVVIWAVTPPLY